jgi:hypothetical protein
LSPRRLPPRFADVGRAQDAQTLGVCGHDAVLDAVVHHLDEMPGPVRAAMQIALLGGAAELIPPRRPVDVADAGGQGREDGVQVLNDRLFAADHQAVAALQPPNPAAGADVHVMDARGRERLGAVNVVHVVGVAAVDQDA